MLLVNLSWMNALEPGWILWMLVLVHWLLLLLAGLRIGCYLLIYPLWPNSVFTNELLRFLVLGPCNRYGLLALFHPERRSLERSL